MDLSQGCWQEATERLSHMQHTLTCRLLDSVKTNTGTHWKREVRVRRAPVSLVGLGHQNMGAKQAGGSLICVGTWDIWGAAEFNLFSFTAVENSISPFHGA